MSATTAQTPVMASAIDFDHKRASKHSALGHFFARFGSKRNRSNSPIAPTVAGKDNQAATLNHQHQAALSRPVFSDEKAQTLDAIHNKQTDGSPSPPAKPKRRSSPFVRVIHRLSMNRNDRSDTVQQRRAVAEHCDLNLSRETVYSTNSPSTANAAISDALSRPAVSENDLRVMSLRKKTDLETNEPMLSHTNAFRSEDNLRPVSPRAPSYLRVSCALNGYRQSYRRPGGAPSLKPQQLPMSIVERRTAVFNSTSQPSVPTPLNNSAGVNASLDSSTPVRELIALFDMAKSDSIEKDGAENRGNTTVEFAGEIGGGSLGSVRKISAHNVDTATPLVHPVPARNSIPISDQVPGAVLSETLPKPLIAQVMHSAVMRTTLPNEPPDQNNHSEVRVFNGFGKEAEMASSVRNEETTNYDLPSGEAYIEMLAKAKAVLMGKAEKAREDLANEDSLPERAAELLRTTSGQAILLATKKMETFAELVKRNLHPDVHDTQTITLSDLSGYWALISMELNELQRAFNQIETLRTSDWQIPVETDRLGVNGKDDRPTANRLTRKAYGGSSSVVVDAKKLAAEALRRQEALADAKRRQRQRQRQQVLLQTKIDNCGGEHITKMIV